jgi:hypothetical protein
MPILARGERLGFDEILDAIGGGMGERSRSRDTKAGRDVAIKVLPESFARDAMNAYTAPCSSLFPSSTVIAATP